MIAANGAEALALSPTGALVVLGPPGCGKTTVLKELVASAARQARRDAAPLPIFISLPDLARTGLPLQRYLVVLARASGADAAFAATMWDALTRGEAFVCLDSLDEVAPAQCASVIALINDVAPRWGGAWIVGSRYTEYKGGQFAAGRFAEWELQPLDAAAQRELAQRLLQTLPTRSPRNDDEQCRDTGDLTERVIGSGLIEALGTDAYAFGHQTFQEYLAATALAAGLVSDDPVARHGAQQLAWSKRTYSRWTETLRLLVGVLARDHGAEGARAAPLDPGVDGAGRCARRRPRRPGADAGAALTGRGGGPAGGVEAGRRDGPVRAGRDRLGRRVAASCTTWPSVPRLPPARVDAAGEGHGDGRGRGGRRGARSIARRGRLRRGGTRRRRAGHAE